jgi:regulator of replication initiation timing
LYQKNLKANTKLLDQIQVLHKKLNAHVITISNLNGGIMSKIRECDGLKMESKVLTSKVMSLLRKSLEVNKQKVEHALQLKKRAKETEEWKVENCKQTKVL